MAHSPEAINCDAQNPTSRHCPDASQYPLAALVHDLLVNRPGQQLHSHVLHHPPPRLPHPATCMHPQLPASGLLLDDRMAGDADSAHLQQPRVHPHHKHADEGSQPGGRWGMWGMW